MKKSDKNINAFTGNGAAAFFMNQINPDVVVAYPITPQTQIIEDLSIYKSKNKIDTEIVSVESEHSAMSACVGASAAGARTMTASSSQGILLMAEVLPIASGSRLPIIMNVVNRAISGPINIHSDHSDSMFVRDAGWIQIFCENPQEVYDHNILGLKLAESKNILLPTMILQDGFTTSHNTEKVEILNDKVIKKFIGDFKPEHSLLNLKKPVTYGPLELFDYYFETKLQQHKTSINEIKKTFIKIGEDLEQLTGRKYFLFEQYHSKDADFVIVCTSSTAGTVKEIVDRLRKNKVKAGLIKIVLYRPFPYDELRSALKKTKAVAVLDKTFSFGSLAPLYKDVIASLKGLDIKTQSYVFGLGGRDIFEEDIVKVFEDLARNKIKDGFESSTKFIGVRE